MDEPRIKRLARILLEYSLEVKAGNSVLIQGPPETKALVLAVYEHALILGAHPWQRIQFPETDQIFYGKAKAHQINFLSPVDLFAIEKFDRILYIRTDSNTAFIKNVNPSLITRRRRALIPAQEILRTKRWCATFYPSRTLSLRAGMSVSAFADNFFRATNRDWSSIEKVGMRLSKCLTRSKNIRIEGTDTDLTFSILGRKPIVGAGRFNMPDGEVFTSPQEDSAKGQIMFEHPVDFEGHKIQGAKLTFHHGKVVMVEAKRGESTLKSLLKTDKGACRLGEFGIGINYDLKESMGHIGIDEKIGGTCHLAIGFSPPGTGGRNRSAIHFDLIKDIRLGGRILADGMIIMENGHLKV